jgi:hypothetical protein
MNDNCFPPSGFYTMEWKDFMKEYEDAYFGHGSSGRMGEETKPSTEEGQDVSEWPADMGG